MPPDFQSRPRLAAGCRLAETPPSYTNGKDDRQHTLLMPERALRLNGPSLQIITRCDGKHTVQQIISDLQKIYSKGEPKKVETDILGYLTLLQNARALDFES